MKRYELTFLILPELSEEEAKAVHQEINSLIETEGVLEDGSILLKRSLAYSILKKKEAYLAVSIFKTEPEKIADIEKRVKENKNILRHLLVVTRKERKEHRKRVKPEGIKSKVTITERTEPKEKKVELKEIGEKLDQILNEPQ